MSYISTIKTEIKDLAALSEACKKIGLKLNEGQTKYKWWGAKKECLHAISVPGNSTAYEIGVNEKNGIYTLSYDPHVGGYGLEEICGKKCENLTQAYTQTVAIREATKIAKSQGYSITEEFDSTTNETVIRLRKY
jgi:hypothetical protein